MATHRRPPHPPRTGASSTPALEQDATGDGRLPGNDADTHAGRGPRPRPRPESLPCLVASFRRDSPAPIRASARSRRTAALAQRGHLARVRREPGKRSYSGPATARHRTPYRTHFPPRGSYRARREVKTAWRVPARRLRERYCGAEGLAVGLVLVDAAHMFELERVRSPACMLLWRTRRHRGWVRLFFGVPIALICTCVLGLIIARLVAWVLNWLSLWLAGTVTLGAAPGIDGAEHDEAYAAMDRLSLSRRTRSKESLGPAPGGRRSASSSYSVRQHGWRA